MHIDNHFYFLFSIYFTCFLGSLFINLLFLIIYVYHLLFSKQYLDIEISCIFNNGHPGTCFARTFQAAGLQFVESHHEVAFFDLWQLDSLLVQLLKCEND